MQTLMEQHQLSTESSYGIDYRLINELLAGLRVERESRLVHDEQTSPSESNYKIRMPTSSSTDHTANDDNSNRRRRSVPLESACADEAVKATVPNPEDPCLKPSAVQEFLNTENPRPCKKIKPSPKSMQCPPLVPELPDESAELESDELAFESERRNRKIRLECVAPSLIDTEVTGGDLQADGSPHRSSVRSRACIRPPRQASPNAVSSGQQSECELHTIDTPPPSTVHVSSSSPGSCVGGTGDGRRAKRSAPDGCAEGDGGGRASPLDRTEPSPSTRRPPSIPIMAAGVPDMADARDEPPSPAGGSGAAA
jgi:hypothetical protein